MEKAIFPKPSNSHGACARKAWRARRRRSQCVSIRVVPIPRIVRLVVRFACVIARFLAARI